MSDTTELPVPSNITPEKDLPTGTPVKHAKADDTRHLLTCAGFEEEEISTYLRLDYLHQRELF